MAFPVELLLVARWKQTARVDPSKMSKQPKKTVIAFEEDDEESDEGSTSPSESEGRRRKHPEIPFQVQVSFGF